MTLELKFQLLSKTDVLQNCCSLLHIYAVQCTDAGVGRFITLCKNS
jgi:hypothetical protein